MINNSIIFACHIFDQKCSRRIPISQDQSCRKKIMVLPSCKGSQTSYNRQSKLNQITHWQLFFFKTITQNTVLIPLPGAGLISERQTITFPRQLLNWAYFSLGAQFISNQIRPYWFFLLGHFSMGAQRCKLRHDRNV